MARHPSSTPTETELQILRVLWNLEPCGVGEIHEQLQSDKGTNYSTTVKMLSVMLAKGLVRRDESKRPHLYRAVWTRERTGKNLLKTLTKKVYEGSVTSLVLQALSSSKASEKDIEQIRKILEEMEARE